MLPVVKGRVAWVFDQPHFDADLIVGVKNISVTDKEKLKDLCMSQFENNFKDNVRGGDVLVGAENFGYGHPHYTSMIAMSAVGIRAVIAESFAPGFFLGELSKGLPLIECPGLSKKVKRFDTIELDWDNETICINGKEIVKCAPIKKQTKDMVECGSVVNYIKEKRLK